MTEQTDFRRPSRQPEADCRAISERLGAGIVERLRARERDCGPLWHDTREWEIFREAADRIEALEAALWEAITKFREYETLHAAKGTLDGDRKARANAEIADRLASALSLPVQRGEG